MQGRYRIGEFASGAKYLSVGLWLSPLFFLAWVDASATVREMGRVSSGAANPVLFPHKLIACEERSGGRAAFPAPPDLRRRLRVLPPMDRALGRGDRECGRLCGVATRSGRGFPEIPEEAFARSVQLVLPDGRVLQGAEAVYRFARGSAAPPVASRGVPARAGFCHGFGARVLHDRPPPPRRVGGDGGALGKDGRASDLPSRDLSLRPARRRLLSGRVCFSLDAGRRSHRIPRAFFPSGIFSTPLDRSSVARAGPCFRRSAGSMEATAFLHVLCGGGALGRSPRDPGFLPAPLFSSAGRPISRSRSSGRSFSSSSGISCCSKPDSWRFSWRRSVDGGSVAPTRALGRSGSCFSGSCFGSCSPRGASSSRATTRRGET